ncbi:hypothetical protein D8824_04955 [Streptococcus intermedius]|nr:hypothetical protein D8833_07370 [Streptococcus intermedius]RSJ16076.1 hypothetical protein D8831_04955 [Streptococcus intermedius]RSJ30825.1 hypothetical protein D8824_04955 [Streptococcus intermedius]
MISYSKGFKLQTVILSDTYLFQLLSDNSMLVMQDKKKWIAPQMLDLCLTFGVFLLKLLSEFKKK